MKVLIIEDEKHTANHLKEILQAYNPEIIVVDILTSVASSVAWFGANKQPDLLFQDIELSDGQCFEIFQRTKIDSPIIFTTAYSEYALKAFEVNSIDYLVKPYDVEDIERVLNKFKNYTHLFQTPESELMQGILHLNNTIIKKRFLIRIGNYKSLRSGEIAYIYTEGGLNFACTIEGNRYPIDQTLNELVRVLDYKDFFRINRNCIVSHQCVGKISTWFNSRLKLTLQPKTELEVIVSRERVREFKNWLGA